jgi:hypothetical protein
MIEVILYMLLLYILFEYISLLDIFIKIPKKKNKTKQNKNKKKQKNQTLWHSSSRCK